MFAFRIYDVIHCLPHPFEDRRLVTQAKSLLLIDWQLFGRLRQELLQCGLRSRDFDFQRLRVGLGFLNHVAGPSDICGRQIGLEEHFEVVQIAHKGLQLAFDVT